MATLNRNNSNWSFEERRKINENWDILEGLANSTASGNNGLRDEVNQLKVTVGQNTTRSTSALQIANQSKAESSSVLPLVNNANKTANEAKATAEGIEAKADQANVNSVEAINIANSANNKGNLAIIASNEAKTTADYVQSQLDNVIADGDSNAEVVQARDNKVNLRARLDDDYNENKLEFRKTNVNIINVESYGSIGNGGDDTSVFLNAINSNPNVNTFKIPGGKFLVNLVLPRPIHLIGDGMFNTELESFNNSLATVNLNGRFNVKITGMTISARYESTAPNIVNARDARYVEMTDVYVLQKENSAGAFSYSTVGLDITNVNATFSGYNTLKNCRFVNCSYGMLTGPSLNSDLHISDCQFWRNGYFGAKLEGVSIGVCENTEFNGNGKIGENSNVFDVDMYGGVYVSGSSFSFKSIWFEKNQAQGSGKIENAIRVRDGSFNITVEATRNFRNNSNVLAQTYEHDNYSLIEELNDGTGKDTTQNLIVNGSYQFFDSNNVAVGWSRQIAAGSTLEKITEGLPSYYQYGARINSQSAGVTINYQTIVPEGQMSKYLGTYFTMTAYVRVTGNRTVRVGFDTGTGNPYFSSGVYYVAPSDGLWNKIVVPMKVTENTNRLLAGFNVTGVGGVLEICGISVNMSKRVFSYEPKTINENGGNVLSQNFMIGGRRHGFAEVIPTSGSWVRGDRLYNINPVAGGSEGWVCTASGSPGTWKTFGSIQS